MAKISYSWRTWEIHAFNLHHELQEQLNKADREGWDIVHIFYCTATTQWPSHFMIVGRREITK